MFTFSSNILDFRRSPSSYLKFGSRHEDLLRFCRLFDRPPRDPKSSFRWLLKQLFCRETRLRGQFVANPSPVIFAGVLASKVRKIKTKIQCQRHEASQRLVKHNIMISLYSFLKAYTNTSTPIEIRKLDSVACFKKNMFAKIFKEQQCLHHFII